MKCLLKISGLFLALSFSLNAWALTINSGATDVGALDTLIASIEQGTAADGTDINSAGVSNPGLLDSGLASEQAWVEFILGFDVSFEFKLDGAFSWDAVDGNSSLYAQALNSDPEYYLVKIGGGGIGDTHFLFDNAASLSYAVIDLGNFADGSTIDIARVSHITEFNGTHNVPEPATLALFGIGLLGLSMARRQKA